MSDALSERIFEVLGDRTSPRILLALARFERSQADLARDLELAPSVVSRTVASLRHLGLVMGGSQRGVLQLRSREEVHALLDAANALAMAVLDSQRDEQHDTRRGAMEVVSRGDRHAGA
jgi:DNA-binding transcriptional ArsR family regulator